MCSYSRSSTFRTAVSNSLFRRDNSSPLGLPSRLFLKVSQSSSACQAFIDPCERGVTFGNTESSCPTEQAVSSSQPYKREMTVKRGIPLSLVVADRVACWFEEYMTNANQGDADAQIIVGEMYIAGYGVPKDVVKGAEWLRKGRLKKKATLKNMEDVRAEEHMEDSANKLRGTDEAYFFM